MQWLTQGYANSCVCSATRTALATGRYQYPVSVGLQEPINDDNHLYALPMGHPTIASLLRGQGYRAALVERHSITAS